VARDNKVTRYQKLVEPIVVTLDYQRVNLLVSVRLGHNFVVVASNDHGLYVAGDFHPIVVAIDCEVLDMVSNSLRAVVLVDRIRILLLLSLGSLSWGTRIIGTSCGGSVLLLSSWLGTLRLRVMVRVMMVVRLVMLLLSSLGHTLRSCIGLLLMLLDESIDIRH
jgi:hypothetical protein